MVIRSILWEHATSAPPPLYGYAIASVVAAAAKQTSAKMWLV